MKKNTEEILRQCNAICKNTLMETLGITFVAIDEDSITARMPVNSKVHQPDGVLHGGASVALAESVGSAGVFVFLDRKDVMVRGIEISANHLKSVKDGYVDAVARLVHKGKTIQLWQINILNSEGDLISLVKLTTITIPQKKS